MKRKTKVDDSDLADILKLLETLSFAKVAEMYGYESAMSTGGTGIRKFLMRHGYDPKDFNKAKGKPKQKEYGHIGGVFTSPQHFIETIYYENGQKIKRYESRIKFESSNC